MSLYDGYYRKDNGAWLLTTYKRADRLNFLLNNLARLGGSRTAIKIAVDEMPDEPRAIAYNAAVSDYRINVSEETGRLVTIQFEENVGLKGVMAREYAAWGRDCQWVGWIQDDHVPLTANWDEIMLSKLEPFRVVVSNDGWQFPNRFHGAVLFDQDFIKMMAAVNVNLNTRYSHYDSLVELVCKSFDLAVYAPEVMFYHDHGFKDPTKMDVVYKENYADLEDENKEWERWLREEKDRVFKQINAYLQEHRAAKMKCLLPQRKFLIVMERTVGQHETAIILANGQTEQEALEAAKSTPDSAVKWIAEPLSGEKIIRPPFLVG